MAADRLFTREEVLGGLPSRRARAVLFLIERQTAHSIAQSGRLDALLPGERAARDRDLAYIRAFALGREPPVRLAIQNIERYADAWAHLVPDNPTLRAGVAHVIAQKHAFTSDDVPGIRRALGLDRDAVKDAYARAYHERLDTIYAERATWRASLRWAWTALGNWLDTLPPFWFVLVFTMALGIPQAIVAYPIAVSAVGALPGLGLTLAAGLLCVVTTASVAEAAARSGVVRYGTAYIGKLATDYLGPAGAGLLSIAVFVLYLATIMGGSFAISRTLAQFTPIPAIAWTVVLFAAGIWLLATGSSNLSLTLLLALAIVIVVLLVVITAVTLGHFRAENLLGPSLAEIADRAQPFGNTIGIILMGFFASAFVVQCAKSVLPRDPSGRSLIWGSVAGLGGIGAVLLLWIVAINGSLDRRFLAAQTATVVTPLAAQIPATALLGTLLVVFLSGLATLRCMIGAFNVAREWLPVQRPASSPLATAQRAAWDVETLSTLAAAMQATAAAPRWWSTDRGRFVLSVTPIALTFALSVLFLVANWDSFPAVLGMLGVITSSIFSGFIPMLLVAASRRKGEVVPGAVLEWLGRPLVIGAVYLIYVVILLIHAFVIWANPALRAIAVLVTVAVLGVTAIVIRQGAFRPRVVVEIRDDRRDGRRSAFSIVAHGRPALADVRLDDRGGGQSSRASAGEIGDFAALRSCTFAVPATGAAELKVWAHRVTPAGESEGLPATIEVRDGDVTRRFDLGLTAGQIVLPFSGGACEVTISLSGAARR